MQWLGLKIPVVIFSLLAGMAFIFGVQWLYQKYSFQEPLIAALKNNKAVEFFQINREDHLYRIDIAVSYDADLMETCKDVYKKLNHIMGRRSFKLVIVDDPDDILNKIWYNSQYAVYQAVVQGNYQNMADVVNREAHTFGAEAKIDIDQENIYLRIKHQGHTLDKVIPRNTGQALSNARTFPVGGEAGL